MPVRLISSVRNSREELCRDRWVARVQNYWLLNPEKSKGKTTEDLDGTETMTVRRNAMIRTAALEKTVKNMMERVAECVALDSLI